MKGLRFCAPRISHYIVVMMLDLAFHSKYPVGVGDTVNVFLCPDLSPVAGSEAELLMRRWDTVLGRGTLTSFYNTSLILGFQKTTPV